jgi:hypothetical protein
MHLLIPVRALGLNARQRLSNPGNVVPSRAPAGERALRASANVEAIRHLSQGLGSLKLLLDTRERQQAELRFQTALGPAYLVDDLFRCLGWR